MLLRLMSPYDFLLVFVKRLFVKSIIFCSVHFIDNQMVLRANGDAFIANFIVLEP